MIHFDVNYLAIFIAATVRMVLGSLWYSPFMFGPVWEKLSGVQGTDPAKMESVSAKINQPAYFSSFIGTLLVGFVLANLFIWAGTAGLINGLVIGFLMWLGFMAPVGLTVTLFSKKSLNLFAIDYGNQLIVLLAMAAIIISWA